VNHDFLEWGARIPDEEVDPLRDIRMRALLNACNAHPHFNVVELRRLDEPFAAEIIVADVGDGAVSPGNDAGIARIERIALLYRDGARFPFEARPLRMGFPVTLHQNSTGDEGPPSLCIVEGDWELIEHKFTPQALLKAILDWLEKTADGTIHAVDRALEPMFYSRGEWLMLPPNIAEVLKDPKKELAFLDAHLWEGGVTYRTRVLTFNGNSEIPRYRLLVVSLEPVGHPPLSSPPSTLGDLESVFVANGVSLMPALAVAVQDAYQRFRDARLEPGDSPLILILQVPRQRDGVIERTDVIGFRMECSLRTLGLQVEALGRFGTDGEVECTRLLLGNEHEWPNSGWQDLSVAHVEVSTSLDRSDALRWSGIEGGQFRGVIAGVGSLGSALISMWSRSAWGWWDYIDPDVLAPHNVVRHIGTRDQVGVPKVAVVRHYVRSALGIDDPNVAALKERASDLESAEVQSCLLRADLLIDASTTVQVSRIWSQADLPRGMTTFLTPSGASCVLLAEDKARTTRGGSLEAQYYRAIIREDWGLSHLQSVGASIRSGASCRDVSSVLAYETVLLHASILAGQIRVRALGAEASIDVWDAGGDGCVRHISIGVRRTVSRKIDDWNVMWDEGLEDQLMAAREQALPLETGGIVLGVVDFKLRTIHLVDGRPAPDDSIPTTIDFQCGKAGVQDDIDEAQRRTMGMVSWVGAWHSHPRGIKAIPSGQDQKLLSHLAQRLGTDGYPAVMLIAGEDGVDVFLREMSSSGPE